MIFPLFHVFRFVLKYKNFKVVRSVSSHPLMVDLLTLTNGKEHKMIGINFTKDSQYVILPVKGEFKIKQLNSESFAEASSDMNWIENRSGMNDFNGGRLFLSPYSVSFVE